MRARPASKRNVALPSRWNSLPTRLHPVDCGLGLRWFRGGNPRRPGVRPESEGGKRGGEVLRRDAVLEPIGCPVVWAEWSGQI